MGKLVEIAHFHDPEEAFCARSYLEAYGVPTIIQNEYHLTAVPWLRVGLGGYPLLANDTDAEIAKELLKNPASVAVDHYDDSAPRKPIWLAFPMGLQFGFLPHRKQGLFGAVITIIFLCFFLLFVFGWGELLVSGLIDAFVPKA